MFSIMFKSGDFFFWGGGVRGGGGRRHLRFLHSDMQWWPMSEGLEHHRAATALWFFNNGMTSVSSTLC